MAYKVKQNVIIDGVAHGEGSVVDLSHFEDDNVKSMVNRGLLEETSDDVATVEAVPGDVTVASAAEQKAAAGPLTDENATGAKQAVQAALAGSETASAEAAAKSAQPTQEEIDAALANENKQEEHQNQSSEVDLI